MDWEPQIISGDAQDVARKVGRQVGISQSEALGGLSPEEKLSIVSRRSAQRNTMMVGDGINDAAALAAADIGIAVHGGAEASLAAADIYIARPGLEPLVELVNTARHTMRIVHRNLVLSLGYNLVAGSLAAAGMMTPLLAAIIMPISSATVLSFTVMAVAGRRNALAKEGPRA
jgi:Cu2+-exporting ATPase